MVEKCPSHHNVWNLISKMIQAFPSTLTVKTKKPPATANRNLLNVVLTVLLYLCDYGSVITWVQEFDCVAQGNHILINNLSCFLVSESELWRDKRQYIR